MTRPAMAIATPLDAATSARWDGSASAISVIVSTHDRAELLAGLLDALETQTDVDAEIVIADNGSQDDTWSVLSDRCASTSLPLLALRLPFHDGPGVPRNTAIARSRAALLAFTDDDCLPTPSWLSALVGALNEGVDLVQGRTAPDPQGWAGPWGRSLDVPAASGLYETANLAVTRGALLDAGGFGAERLLSGRAFGEDVVLGARIARSGGFSFAADALVHHRVMPGTFRDFISEQGRLRGFPALLRQVPELRRAGYARIFLSRRTGTTDLGLGGITAGGIAGLVTESAWPLFAWLAAVPWLVTLWREAGHRPGRSRAIRAAQLAVADLVGAVALATGSLSARRILL